MEARIVRRTKETSIELILNDEFSGRKIYINCGFLAHMIDLLCHRASLGVELTAHGDIEVDSHHLTEDVGMVMGQALRRIAAERPIRRYASALLPMDGSLARIALDFSGRGGLWWRGEFPSQKCGDFDTELVPEFFAGFAREAGLTLHIALLETDNSHHAAEAVFKGVGLALKEALAPSESAPSTKGVWL
ncbi:imidazoleglycerol-phosphate dehydratase [Synergistes jonesii]|uniref:Imidazoleglycerol-phosphate dehydratase n=1 Tax=Synergistes jonesii TaxID=2754 RepID=A0A073ISA0_9BACT|nr:imidazoleglycerol-phosphate dehydratase [Synergistes jonesii]KEJ92425.1 imidazoleglycerol-phosphate dehydratase [Synergistes jonesii]OFB63062.1 imidazoleglycerol-phosphate dehydratase [Synergistes jonesii]OFB63936.1 imidazoleglycerol-phosphate dehydratase [Synergistes jonesii]OFB65869.1 imidazoleglycerol-phosphate dehydratase [Synergistes jonesii]OFB67803.1 imidazoleglycerol-phosphate dehydratase [Synergistes jonesii]